MIVLSKYEVSHVVDGGLIKTVVRWYDETVKTVTAAVDSAQIYVNSKTAKNTCGDGNIDTVTTKGFTCK